MAKNKLLDYKLIGAMVLYYTIVALINGIKNSYWNVIGEYGVDWKRIWLYNVFLDWLVVCMFMIAISILAKKMFERNMSTVTILIIHFICSLSIGFVIFIMSSFILFLFSGDIDLIVDNVTIDHYMRFLDINFMVYFSMLGIIYGYYYLEKIKKIEADRTNLQSKLITSKMSVLKSKLHPHFVFNTLNSISSLIDIDKEKSQDMITDFGDLFRDILDLENKNLIPLKQELDMLKKYIDIISIRFSDHLSFEEVIDNQLDEHLVPVMLLQPIIENSIKHGYSYNSTELNVILRIFKDDQYLHIEVENDGQPLQQPFNDVMIKGVGIKNIQDRLETLYKGDFSFKVENIKDNQGVKTSIMLPLEV
ncbi:sensor histidine kinase [Psychroserpens luteolus]|uniref:sensor histidine kinase n=1 Tax=Psychroserpens luteolus TaxID=2855840 RepID=UPI001E4DF796|nr:histidine kinase [Psychroserpens luteolus]MCD2260769.1 histidine kinase [Psychroserpens luteolus]